MLAFILASFWYHCSILFRHRFLDAFLDAVFSIVGRNGRERRTQTYVRLLCFRFIFATFSEYLFFYAFWSPVGSLLVPFWLPLAPFWLPFVFVWLLSGSLLVTCLIRLVVFSIFEFIGLPVSSFLSLLTRFCNMFAFCCKLLFPFLVRLPFCNMFAPS